jgi:DNA-binding NtrC family response regulator
MKKVLYLEDEQFIAEHYIKALEKAQYEVRWTQTPNKTIEAAKTFSADIALIDYGMKEGGTGLDCILSLKQLLPTIQIILLSNYDAPFLQKEMKKKKIDPNYITAILHKMDVTFTEIAQKLKELC